MGQFVNCIKGIKKACVELNFPVVSGNVSFYNQTDGKSILPTRPSEAWSNKECSEHTAGKINENDFLYNWRN